MEQSIEYGSQRAIIVISIICVSRDKEYFRCSQDSHCKVNTLNNFITKRIKSDAS